jgi:hypothetical protein
MPVKRQIPAAEKRFAGRRPLVAPIEPGREFRAAMGTGLLLMLGLLMIVLGIRWNRVAEAWAFYQRPIDGTISSVESRGESGSLRLILRGGSTLDLPHLYVRGPSDEPWPPLGIEHLRADQKITKPANAFKLRVGDRVVSDVWSLLADLVVWAVALASVGVGWVLAWLSVRLVAALGRSAKPEVSQELVLIPAQRQGAETITQPWYGWRRTWLIWPLWCLPALVAPIVFYAMIGGFFGQGFQPPGWGGIGGAVFISGLLFFGPWYAVLAHRLNATRLSVSDAGWRLTTGPLPVPGGSWLVPKASLERTQVLIEHWPPPTMPHLAKNRVPGYEAGQAAPADDEPPKPITHLVVWPYGAQGPCSRAFVSLPIERAEAVRDYFTYRLPMPQADDRPSRPLRHNALLAVEPTDGGWRMRQQLAPESLWEPITSAVVGMTLLILSAEMFASTLGVSLGRGAWALLVWTPFYAIVHGLGWYLLVHALAGSLRWAQLHSDASGMSVRFWPLNALHGGQDWNERSAPDLSVEREETAGSAKPQPKVGRRARASTSGGSGRGKPRPTWRVRAFWTTPDGQQHRLTLLRSLRSQEEAEAAKALLEAPRLGGA